MNSRVELAAFVKTILNAEVPVHELRPEIMAIKKILVSLADFDDHPAEGIAFGESMTDHGLAISPSNAALCVDDYVRTIQFIRGLHQAILDQDKAKVSVLYAGCGPLGVLAIPLLCYFEQGKVAFQLLDIHETSVASLNHIIKALELPDQLITVTCCDVMSYQAPKANMPDIVLLEVMQAGLRVEPQVAASRYLMAQFPQATLIPESVSIEMMLVNPQHEFGLMNDERAAHRIHLGTAFTLNKAVIDSWACLDGLQLPAEGVIIPVEVNDNDCLMEMTSITVYSGHEIEIGQSGLTSALRFDCDVMSFSGQILALAYGLSQNPGLFVLD